MFLKRIENNIMSLTNMKIRLVECVNLSFNERGKYLAKDLKYTAW